VVIWGVKELEKAKDSYEFNLSDPTKSLFVA
jgi:hypothetical protein